MSDAIDVNGKLVEIGDRVVQIGGEVQAVVIAVWGRHVTVTTDDEINEGNTHNFPACDLEIIAKRSKTSDDDPTFNTIPAEAYPRTNRIARSLIDSLMDICVLKGYISQDENDNLRNEDSIAQIQPGDNAGVAEALCILMEAFNF